MRKVVITAAGLGTRVLPMTKELPKEMLPILMRRNRRILLVPLLQAIFEQLFDAGFREFCFVIGRGKRAIEDHFTPDWGFVDYLKEVGKEELALDLESFYRKIERSYIVWVNQPSPRGFGDAVLRAKAFVKDEDFLVHAGDTYIHDIGSGTYYSHISELISIHRKENSSCSFLAESVDDPRAYGVIVGERVSDRLIAVRRVIEKPEKPPSNLAIMPVYAFEPSIFKILEKLEPGYGGEIQLTDGIQKLIDGGGRAYALELGENHLRFDIGTPETYWDALRKSYELLAGAGI